MQFALDESTINHPWASVNAYFLCDSLSGPQCERMNLKILLSLLKSVQICRNNEKPKHVHCTILGLIISL